MDYPTQLLYAFILVYSLVIGIIVIGRLIPVEKERWNSMNINLKLGGFFFVGVIFLIIGVIIALYNGSQLNITTIPSVALLGIGITLIIFAGNYITGLLKDQNNEKMQSDIRAIKTNVTQIKDLLLRK